MTKNSTAYETRVYMAGITDSSIVIEFKDPCLNHFITKELLDISAKKISKPHHKKTKKIPHFKIKRHLKTRISDKKKYEIKFHYIKKCIKKYRLHKINNGTGPR